jgi:hypothetical protein
MLKFVGQSSSFATLPTLNNEKLATEMNIKHVTHVEVYDIRKQYQPSKHYV